MYVYIYIYIHVIISLSLSLYIHIWFNVIYTYIYIYIYTDRERGRDTLILIYTESSQIEPYARLSDLRFQSLDLGRLLQDIMVRPISILLWIIPIKICWLKLCRKFTMDMIVKPLHTNMMLEPVKPSEIQNLCTEIGRTMASMRQGNTYWFVQTFDRSLPET